jgi:hypothetical protein
MSQYELSRNPGDPSSWPLFSQYIAAPVKQFFVDSNAEEFTHGAFPESDRRNILLDRLAKFCEACAIVDGTTATVGSTPAARAPDGAKRWAE